MMKNSEIIEKKFAEAVKGIKDEWFTTSNEKWYNYIIGLPIPLQITYLTIVFHNQIFNGGFHQYFVNGYGQFAKETINVLTTIGALNKTQLLKEALLKVNADNNTDRIFRKRLLEKDIEALFVNDDLFEQLDKLDIQYYANEKEDVEQLLGDYLRSH